MSTVVPLLRIVGPPALLLALKVVADVSALHSTVGPTAAGNADASGFWRDAFYPTDNPKPMRDKSGQLWQLAV